MKVCELIKDTVWFPGRDYDTAQPLISVLMPTFRRGNDGSFLKAANSILAQSLRNIELIVVDDGSRDGTAQQIETLMAADGRVSCLRHPENIGLPAISEYEAFVRARGEYIAFGFDDFVFGPSALFDLMEFPSRSLQSVVHGYVGWFDGHGNQHFYGKDEAPYENLRFFNFLGNSSFLVPRAILQDVGLFDPHIAATRMCDWDLWYRILRKYPIYRAPVFVGIEHGNTRADSLGNTYPLIEEAFQEYFAANREEALKPEHFVTFDVWRMPENCSALLVTHVLRSRQFFRSCSWARAPQLAPDADDEISPWSERSAIGIYGALSRSMADIFDSLPVSHKQNLLYIHPHLTDAQVARYLAACGAIIMAENPVELHSVRVRSMCAAIGLPVYQLTSNRTVPSDDLDVRDVNLAVDAHEQNLRALTEIIRNCQPVNAVNWTLRLRELLDWQNSRIVDLEVELRDRAARLEAAATRLAAADVELASSSYRLALKIRKIANWIRGLVGWNRPR